jgi:hypothetical protein
MSHHFIVPTNENGVSLDADIGADIGLAMNKPFAFTNVFLYSHGWWTNAVRAMEGYNRFTIEFSAQFRSAPGLTDLPTLNIGIHWPSTLTEDQFSLLNYAEALSFFTMEKRADTVGENCAYALLKLILAARPAGPLRLHLVGHSFGCKVVCNALQQLAEGLADNPIASGIEFNVALLQAAFDNDALAPGNDYADVASLPGLRLLITHSDLDRALGTLYPKVHQLAHLFHNVQPALGSSGPTPAVIQQLGDAQNVEVTPGFNPPMGSLAQRLIVANLTALHEAHPENNDSNTGHHSDMFLTEIYRLLQAFVFGASAG